MKIYHRIKSKNIYFWKNSSVSEYTCVSSSSSSSSSLQSVFKFFDSSFRKIFSPFWIKRIHLVMCTCQINAKMRMQKNMHTNEIITQKSISLGHWLEYAPIKLCQTPSKPMKSMQTMERNVKYDTGGNDLFTTHLNDMLESKIVYVVGNLFAGNDFF